MSERKSDAVSAFSIPSAAQKRRKANGRSSDTNKRTTSSCLLIRWQKVLSWVAQTPVSTLGKMLMMTFMSLRLARVRVLRSVLMRAKSGAWVPTAGRSPSVFTVSSLNVIWAMMLFLVWVCYGVISIYEWICG